MPVYEQNIQMTLFEQPIYENMGSTWGPSAFYNFAHSAVDRSRSRSAIWNGDSYSNFSGLAYSVASGIRASLTSFPVWGSDTGGYIRGTNDPTEGEEVVVQIRRLLEDGREVRGVRRDVVRPQHQLVHRRESVVVHLPCLELFIKSHTYEST